MELCSHDSSKISLSDEVTAVTFPAFGTAYFSALYNLLNGNSQTVYEVAV